MRNRGKLKCKALLPPPPASHTLRNELRQHTLSPTPAQHPHCPPQPVPLTLSPTPCPPHSGFLDRVCTHILNYEGRKLKTYRGNLSEFVKQYPAAKSYYELTNANVAFKFPEPGFLEGVKTKDKAILKMIKVGFSPLPLPPASPPCLSPLGLQKIKVSSLPSPSPASSASPWCLSSPAFPFCLPLVPHFPCCQPIILTPLPLPCAGWLQVPRH